MKRLPLLLLILAGSFILVAADGCSSDPNVEGAKLDLGNKDYDRALENIAKALENDPENGEAHALKGEIIQEMLVDIHDAEERTVFVGEMAEAFSRSLELDSTRAVDIRRRLAIAYRLEFNRGIEGYMQAQSAAESEKREGYELAASHFRNASIIYPDSTDAYVNEASAYYSGGMLPWAIDTYEAALSVGHTEHKIFVYLASVYDLVAQAEPDSVRRIEHYKRMVRTLEEGLGHHPGDAELRNMLLNAYALAEEQERAVEFYGKEFYRERNNKVFLYNYGTLLLRLNDYDGAIATLTSAVNIDSTYANAQYNLGAAFVNKAIGLGAEYRVLDDTLQVKRISLPASRIAQIQERMKTLDEQRITLFRQAVVHLEIAKVLTEDSLREPRDICRALYRAYGHTNQRRRAEALVNCAKFEES